MSEPDWTSVAGILFDKDGTLLRYDESWGPVNREAARIAAAGNPELEEKLLYAAGMDPVSGHTRADSLLAAANAAEIAAGFVAAGSTVETGELKRLLDDLFIRGAEWAVPVTDLDAFFGRLKASGLRLGVASSDSEAAIRRTAIRFGFDRHLDFIAGYDSGHGAKPGPGMLVAFCEAVGLHPSQVAMVGDNNHDMQMGRAAGAGINVAVMTGTGSRETLAKAADICLDDITALASRLLQKLEA